MKHISWIAIGVTSIVVIGLILYFILPHPAYSSSELSEEESEWVDPRPKVEQSFIEMYDSLSTETIASFIQDWQKWSGNRLVDATDTLVNRLYQLSLSRYTSSSIKLDSAQYVVRDYYLEIYRSEESYTENKDLDSYVFTDTLFVVPPSTDGRRILYVTPEIDKLLEAYLNWVFEYSEEPYSDEFKTFSYSSLILPTNFPLESSTSTKAYSVLSKLSITFEIDSVLVTSIIMERSPFCISFLKVLCRFYTFA